MPYRMRTHGKIKIAGLKSFFFRTYCYSHCCQGHQTMSNLFAAGFSSSSCSAGSLSNSKSEAFFADCGLRAPSFSGDAVRRSKETIRGRESLSASFEQSAQSARTINTISLSVILIPNASDPATHFEQPSPSTRMIHARTRTRIQNLTQEINGFI